MAKVKLRPTVCGVCGSSLTGVGAAGGRPRKWCSKACRQEAYLRRRYGHGRLTGERPEVPSLDPPSPAAARALPSQPGTWVSDDPQRKRPTSPEPTVSGPPPEFLIGPWVNGGSRADRRRVERLLRKKRRG